MTDDIMRAGLAISGSTELALVAKVTAIVLVGLSAAWLLRWSAASVRALVLSATFLAVALLPLAARLAPPLVIPMPAPTSHVVDGGPDAWAEAIDSAPVLPRSGTPSTGEVPAAAVAPRLDLRTMVRSAWMLGVALMLVPFVATLWRLRAIRRSGIPWRAGETLARRLAMEAGVRRPIAVLRHEAVSVPMTSGLWRPALLLPWDASTWSDEDVARVFVHEIEHVRRGDWAVLLLAHLVCAAFWFHPIVWLARRQLSLAVEKACDDAVVCRADGAPYAVQLVHLAERLSGRDPRPILSMANRRDLTARVAAVLDRAQTRGRTGRAATVGALVGAALCLLALAPLAAGRESPAGEAAVSQDAGPAQLTFEVVSVRKNAQPVRIPPPQQPPRRPDVYYASSVTVAYLIRFAYGIRDVELIGGPDWIRRDEFEINAKAPREASADEMRLMLQALLEDRFALVVRREQREMRFFELRVARDDGRLGPALQACEDPEADRNAPPGPPVRLPPGGMPASMRCRPMSALADMASGMVRAPVTDGTGLPGLWSFMFMFLQPNLPGSELERARVERVPSFEEGLREYLGLTLESRRGPVDVLVVESVEPPTEN